jgi:hypothetical protein
VCVGSVRLKPPLPPAQLPQVSGPGGKLCDDSPLYALNVSVGDTAYPALTAFLKANALLLQVGRPVRASATFKYSLWCNAAPHHTLCAGPYSRQPPGKP